jgi:hypothetical protein
MTKFAVIAAAALLATTGIANARDYSRYDEIDQRQANQQQRIEQGRRDGSLTREEYRRLMAEQERIADMERRAKGDGRVDRHEAARIRQAQDEASRHIYQERHDSETSNQRFGWRFWWRRWN